LRPSQEKPYGEEITYQRDGAVAPTASDSSCPACWAMAQVFSPLFYRAIKEGAAMPGGTGIISTLRPQAQDSLITHH